MPYLFSLDTLGFLLVAGVYIYFGKLFTENLKWHIQQLSEEFEDHHLLSIPDLNKLVLSYLL